MSTRVERAIEALRKPDCSLANVANTVRQSLAGIVEDQAAHIEALETALLNLVNAKALSGVRKLIAGWNGEGLDEPYKERHPYSLGAVLKTCCGEVYELDEAMKTARAALDKDAGQGE
jgi:hypothetical protein